MSDNIQFMQELIDYLNYHTKLYDEGKPDITDAQWNEKYFELQQMERATGVYLPNSPTQKIDYQVVSELQKVQQQFPGDRNKLNQKQMELAKKYNLYIHMHFAENAKETNYNFITNKF